MSSTCFEQGSFIFRKTVAEITIKAFVVITAWKTYHITTV